MTVLNDILGAIDLLYGETRLHGLKVYANSYMTITVPAPNRPRVKKKNKRATRRYWARQPKFVQAPDPDAVRIGDAIVAHPATLVKIAAQFKREV